MKLKFVSLICLFLLISTPLFAENFVVPEQKIVGIDKVVPLGELVDIALSPIDEKTKPKNLVGTSVDWKVLDFADGGKEKKIRVTDDGVMFGAGIVNKRFVVICAVTHLYVSKNDKNVIVDIGTKTVFYRADLIIGSTEPTPPPTPPTPVPVPTPTVVLPAGKYNLAQTIYDLSKVVPEDPKKKGAIALTSSFKGISAAIAAGALKEPKDILEKTKQANQEALKNAGVSDAYWIPVFAPLMEKIYDLHASSNITTANDYKTAWDEIVVGFQAIK